MVHSVKLSFTIQLALNKLNLALQCMFHFNKSTKGRTDILSFSIYTLETYLFSQICKHTQRQIEHVVPINHIWDQVRFSWLPSSFVSGLLSSLPCGLVFSENSNNDLNYISNLIKTISINH